MESTAPVLNQKSNDFFNQEVANEIIAYSQKKQGPTTVLIDGKAAAGKSTLAEALAELLIQQKQPFCIIEADWFLMDRPYRTRELQRIMSTATVYADSHVQFWNWGEFQIQLQKIQDQAPTGGQVTLTGLYDRSTGECNARMNLDVPQNAIILVPGCYLLSQKLDYDLAIMLYVNREIGRQRKMNREYQKSKEGILPGIQAMGMMILTWELLEEPTFFRHMIKNGDKAHIIVDTSGPGLISIVKFEIIKTRPVAVRGRAVPDQTQQAVARFIKAQSDVGQEVVELVGSGRPGMVTISEGEIKLTVSM